MCAGYLTLEGLVVVDGEVTADTDGWGRENFVRGLGDDVSVH